MLMITGASGLVGRETVNAAISAGYDVVAVGRTHPPTLPPQARFYSADLSDPTQAEQAVRELKPRLIIHAAWETRQPTYWEAPSNLCWLLSTARMAIAFADIGGRRFVQVGTCAEYAFHGERRDEPATRYGKAKLAAFQAIVAAAHDCFAATEARIFWVYGPGENAKRFIPTMCCAHTAGRVPELGSGRQQRDLLYVSDAAQALIRLLADNAPTGVVDIGTGQPTLLANVAEIVARLAGASLTGLGGRADRPGDPERLLANAEKLLATGWRQEVYLDDGLSKTFAWWRQMMKEDA